MAYIYTLIGFDTDQISRTDLGFRLAHCNQPDNRWVMALNIVGQVRALAISSIHCYHKPALATDTTNRAIDEATVSICFCGIRSAPSRHPPYLPITKYREGSELLRPRA